MKKRFLQISLMLFLCLTLTLNTSWAKSSSGGFSSSAGRSSSSGSKSSGPSGGFSSSATKLSTSTSTEKSSGSFGSSVSKQTVDPKSESFSSSVVKPTDKSSGSFGSSVSNKTTTIQPMNSSSKTLIQTKMDREYSKQESSKAYASYANENSKFKQQSTTYSSPSTQERTTVNVITKNVYYRSPQDYYNRRSSFYTSYNWSPPIYIHNSYSRFGIYDATFLWLMMDHLADQQYMMMYYNHRNEPGMQQFRQELNRLAVDNVELREKIAALDSRTKTLEEKGTQVDTSYVPPDARDVVLAADVATKEIPVKRGFPWGWFSVFIIISIIGIVILYVVRRRII